jgi:hypothetical protein
MFPHPQEEERYVLTYDEILPYDKKYCTMRDCCMMRDVS